MPSVGELTALSSNYLLGPRPGPSVCESCFNLTEGYSRCYTCSDLPAHLATVLPISYSVSGGQLHHTLAGYKRTTGGGARWMAVQLAAILWRFLVDHESCVARSAGTEHFAVVATVPSGDRRKDDRHPLRHVVGELCGPTRERHERLLVRSDLEVGGRLFDLRKYVSTRALDGDSVLLIDDTWTTGANAQSAAAALLQAGAQLVAAVVIGRYLNRDWGQNQRRLRAMPRPFRWDSCALHGTH